MNASTRVRLLRENAARFRAQAEVDRPMRESWLQRARSADKRATELEQERGDGDE